LDFDGTYYQFANVGIGLASFQITGVPVLFACHLGAKRPEQFDRAARLGNGFITISEDPQGFAQINSHVKTAAHIHNKDFSSMEKVMYMTINLNDDLEIAKKESDQFLKAYYGINMWSQLWGPWGPSKLTIQRIQEFSESGASTIIIRFASFDVEKQLAKFLKEIWPYFS
jgi:alkanesulfonate monooxygenase SsuD/methylene tetrahydromethanopterin reductase-like flavin-dependent oxidoreductase (luciferase family)